ncbi:MAG: efflux RND transporter permease subunit [Akkermansiaceae bacterium]|nr:efflux RND transporter permease subunit [Akkermansiaceae bacterium]
MFSQFFIKRPKFAFVISILMMLAGILCLTKMPVSEYPEVSPPTISVRMNYAGASAEELAQVVAAPVEEQLIGMDDLLYFSSSCSNDGSYSLTLIFATGTNDDMAMVNVSNAIKAVESKLPDDIKKTGYHVRKRSGDMLCFLAFTCDENEMNILELTNWLRMNVKDQLGQVEGVSEADVMMSRNYSMRVWLNTTRMSALNITPQDVNEAIAAQNIQAAAGSVGSQDENSYATYKVTATGRLKTVEEFGNIIVKRGEEGHVTKLSDIATIELGAESNSGYSRMSFKDKDGKWTTQNSVGMRVMRNNDANAMATVAALQTKMAELEKLMPKGVTWTMGYDPTKAIEATMEEIIETLVVALLLVIFITYLFLQNWRATLIPALAIPISLLGAFVILYVLGYSVNVLTMFGLILVIGSLVDDAIVVVENVMRIIEEEGISPKEATIKGMKQITGAIIATTLVTIAVYVPIAFYGGMVGVIYTQFSVTMCVALCISTFNALTLSPALCALILKPKGSKPNKFAEYVFRPFNWVMDKSKNIYLAGSSILVRHAWLTVLVLGGVLYANYAYFAGAPAWWNEIWSEPQQPTAPQQKKQLSKFEPINLLAPEMMKSSFIPTEDKGAIFCMVNLEGTATAKQRTDKVIHQMEERIKKIPGVRMISAQSGFSFASGSGEGTGMVIVQLDPWDERTTEDLSVSAIAAAINKSCADIPEASIMAVTPPAIQGLGLYGGVSMVLEARGNATPKDMGDMVKEVCKRLMARPDLIAMARSEYNAETPQIHLEIDRAKAQSLKIPVRSIFSTLQSVLASSYVNDFTLNGFNFKVKVQGDARDRRTADDILNQWVRNENGVMVPLSAVCKLSYRMGPSTYGRFNQYMCADINVTPATGVGSGQVMDFIEQTLDEINKEERAKGLDRQWKAEWKDLSYQERQNDGQIGWLIGLAILFSYFFLVAQYESWTTPIPVMLSVSVATLGAFMGAQICNLTLSIYVQLGILMLIGLSAKNAILMVEFSKEDHEIKGNPVKQAAINGAGMRFRAVLMTAISFLFGVWPMVVASGSGAASRQEIGITTFSGMLLATVFGIFLVPGLYSIFARMRDWTAEKIGMRRKAKLD